jgi:hypothetical protein
MIILGEAKNVDNTHMITITVLDFFRFLDKNQQKTMR